MSAAICYYKWQCDVGDPDDDTLDWLFEQEPQTCYWCRVGEDDMPPDITAALIAAGCDEGDSVLLRVDM
jgi:hypothetical protein